MRLFSAIKKNATRKWRSDVETLFVSDVTIKGLVNIDDDYMYEKERKLFQVKQSLIKLFTKFFVVLNRNFLLKIKRNIYELTKLMKLP